MHSGNSRSWTAMVVGIAALAVVGSATALDLDRTYDDGGGTDDWTEAANWDPDTAGGPYNIGNIHFFVAIPDGELVIFDRVEPVSPGDPGPPTQLDSLILGNDARLQLNPDTELEILGDAELAGILDAQGGRFTALDPTGALSGDRARLYSSAAGLIDVRQEVYASTGLWASWDPSGAFGDQVGTWFPELIKAEGINSQIVLSSTLAIDADFASTGNDHSYQQIEAIDGGAVDLSGVQTIAAPRSGRDAIELTSSGAGSMIDLQNLVEIDATYNGETNYHGYIGTAKVRAADGGALALPSLASLERTNVEVVGGSALALPSLSSSVDTTYLVDAGSAITDGAAAYTIDLRGIWDSWDPSGAFGDQVGAWSPEVIKAEGAGSHLDLSSADLLDAGFASIGNDHTRQTVHVSGGAVVDLSGVTNVISPHHGRDYLEFVVDGADSQLLLDALTHIEGRPGEWAGTTRFSLSDGASVSAPALHAIENVWFEISGGASLAASGANGVFSTLGNWDSWDPSGAFGDQVGTWQPDLIKVEGGGSRLELPSVGTIDAGFTSGGNDHNYQQLRALDGGLVDLSGVETILTPVSSRDRLDIVASGVDSLVDLSSLQQISHGGRHARIEAIGGGEVVLGSLFALDPSLRVEAADADSTLRVLGSIHKHAGNLLAGSPGANLRVGGRFGQEETDPTRLPLGDKDNGGARVIMDGAADRLLEVGGTDVSTAVGFLPDGNFGFGQLVVGADGEATTVRLLDVADNGHRGGLPEALYLYGVEIPAAAVNAAEDIEPAREHGLKIGPGSTLVLNNLNVYAWDETAGSYVDIKSLFDEGVTSIPYDEGTIELRRGSAVAGDVWHRPGRVANGAVDDADVTLMLEAARGASPHARFDLDADGDADGDDVDYLLHTILGTNHGDANLDGVVDVIDLGRLGLSFGDVGDLLWGDGDFNADRFVDVVDLGVLGLNFGAATPAAADTPAAIPEPGSLVLLALGGLALHRRVRRR